MAEDVLIAGSFFKRIKGLLGRRNLDKGQALIITPCNSIHTVFMRFPIDVLFVDKTNKVIQALPDVKPFKFTGIYFQANEVIELPCETIKNSLTSIGDQLSFE